jgi:hypothetical protein
MTVLASEVAALQVTAAVLDADEGMLGFECCGLFVFATAGILPGMFSYSSSSNIGFWLSTLLQSGQPHPQQLGMPDLTTLSAAADTQVLSRHTSAEQTHKC